jgi:GNAT superfamily N-acetyltransferase
MRTVHLKRPELFGETEIAVQNRLKQAFPDAVGDCYSGVGPDRIVLLYNADHLIGHIAAYVRRVLIDHEALTIGLIGDVAIKPAFQSQGHAKRLIQAAHAFFGEPSLPFSVLFAFEPECFP